ncbi:hypothetical protein ACFL12_03450 [Pseudomonadota bacterium]
MKRFAVMASVVLGLVVATGAQAQEGRKSTYKSIKDSMSKLINNYDYRIVNMVDNRSGRAFLLSKSNPAGKVSYVLCDFNVVDEVYSGTVARTECYVIN